MSVFQFFGGLMNNKVLNSKSFIKVLAILILITIASCTKEGPTGPPGKDGVDGKDANIVCGTCHNNTSGLLAKQNQWKNSLHAQGINFTRNSNQCAFCHTEQGFLESIKTGKYATAGTINDPVGITCRTCHNVHTKFDSTDYALTYSEPVKFMFDETKSHDFGKGNICARCHQARTLSPKPVVGGENVTINNSRWGPHNNPSANVVAGIGAFELPGSPYTNSPHKNLIGNSCVTCHMANPIGAHAGGHSMNMFAHIGTTKTPNLAGCQGSNCHDNITTFDYEGVQTEVKQKLTELRNLLAAKNYIDTSASGGEYHYDIMKASQARPLTMPANHAAAAYNYLMVARDKSLGIHNSRYVKAVLNNSIAALSD